MSPKAVKPSRSRGFKAKEVVVKRLLSSAKARLPRLKEVLAEALSHWGYEDPIYRFYHHSFKVYELQKLTQRIVKELKALAPRRPLDQNFQQIISDGANKHFDPSHNKEWLRHTRPIVEAFFHARYMLEMVCKYAQELKEPPQTLPSGWASVLSLYNLR